MEQKDLIKERRKERAEEHRLAHQNYMARHKPGPPNNRGDLVDLRDFDWGMDSGWGGDGDGGGDGGD